MRRNEMRTAGFSDIEINAILGVPVDGEAQKVNLSDGGANMAAAKALPYGGVVVIRGDIDGARHFRIARKAEVAGEEIIVCLTRSATGTQTLNVHFTGPDGVARSLAKSLTSSDAEQRAFRFIHAGNQRWATTSS